MKKTNNQVFFDVCVHIPEVKGCISGSNEKQILKVLSALGYKINIDFVRQYPIGNKFVLDFAFVNPKVCLEVDGSSHNSKKQRQIDKKRDKYLYENNWVVIRIPDEKFHENPLFFKYLIDDVVKFRLEEFNSGNLGLSLVDITDFNDF